MAVEEKEIRDFIDQCMKGEPNNRYNGDNPSSGYSDEWKRWFMGALLEGHNKWAGKKTSFRTDFTNKAKVPNKYVSEWYAAVKDDMGLPDDFIVVRLSEDRRAELERQREMGKDAYQGEQAKVRWEEAGGEWETGQAEYKAWQTRQTATPLKAIQKKSGEDVMAMLTPEQIAYIQGQGQAIAG